MSAQVSIFRGKVFGLVLALALAAAASGNAIAGGHGGGGGFHGGYGGGWGGHGYSGGHGSYGGWHGYYGGYRGPWRGGWGWAGWGYGCCGWGWSPWLGLGWSVAALPVGYTTLWWGDVPYYYANNYYYVWDTNAGQYEAVEPPSGVGGTPPASSAPPVRSSAAGNGSWTDLFAYPKGGQSPEQQLRDREECRTWAVSQTGFDPSKPTSDNLKDWEAKRDTYLRAEAACLQARNYSVK